PAGAHGRVRLGRRPAERQSARDRASARETGGALRAAHDAGAVRLDARTAALPRTRVDLDARSPDARAAAAIRCALARRRRDFGARRGVDAQCRPRPCDRIPTAQRSRGRRVRARARRLDRRIALTAGEIDFAGIQPAHAAFVRRRPDLAVLDYPQIYPYGIVFNTRRPPFDDVRVRGAVALAVDRQEIVDGYLYGFGSVADGPVP